MRQQAVLLAALLLMAEATPVLAQAEPTLCRVLPASDSAAARLVLRRTRDWHDAIMRGDTVALRQILLPDFSLAGPPAVDSIFVPLGQYLSNMAAYQLQADRWEASDVRVLGNVAVVTSRYWQQASSRGQDRSGYYIITDIWKHSDSSWRAFTRWAAWLDMPGGISPAARRQ